MESTTSRPARGRPRAFDADGIGALAFELIESQGYAATTMEQIAAAAGISTPTLFRYFPTKAALLWHGVAGSERDLRAAWADRDPRLPLVDALFAAYARMLDASDTRRARVKARVAAVGREPAIDAEWERYARWRDLVTGFVAEYRGTAPDDLTTRVLGASSWAAIWAAVSDWATGPDDDPASSLAGALAAIRHHEPSRSLTQEESPA